MLDFIETFPRKGFRKEKGCRCRIIGESGCSNLIYCINSAHETSIEIVSPDGSSITALSFSEYFDIINADISSDNELIHVTRRIASPNGFAFSSIVYHIHSRAKSKEILSDQPINAFFIPEVQNQCYQFIHIIGYKMAHLRAFIKKDKVEVERYRGGINIPNVNSWTYHRTTNHLLVIYQSENLHMVTEFDLKNFKQPTSVPLRINIDPQSTLPNELSLNPCSVRHFPFFRCKTNRIFAAKYHSKVCIIQQLFESLDVCLSFSVDLYPNNYSNIISVQTAAADLPINCMQFGSMVIVFVANSFIFLIDISSNPPFISLEENPFATGPCSDCTAALPLHGHIVDLISGDVFAVRPSLKKSSLFVSLFDRSKIDLIAMIAARIRGPESFASALDALSSTGDASYVQHFIRRIIQYLCGNQTEVRHTLQRGNSCTPRSLPNIQSSPRSIREKHRNQIPEHIKKKVNEINIEYPSASRKSRKSSFKDNFRKIMERKGARTAESAAIKALSQLELENEAILFLRSGFDAWMSSFSPSTARFFVAGFCLLSETVILNLPSVLALRNEVESAFSQLGPPTIHRTLVHAGVFGVPRVREEEAAFWRARMPPPPLLNDDSSSSGRDASKLSSVASLDVSDLTPTISFM